jgi:hypothetical protein
MYVGSVYSLSDVILPHTKHFRREKCEISRKHGSVFRKKYYEYYTDLNTLVTTETDKLVFSRQQTVNCSHQYSNGTIEPKVISLQRVTISNKLHSDITTLSIVKRTEKLAQQDTFETVKY